MFIDIKSNVFYCVSESEHETDVVSYQLKLIKMRATLPDLNDCAATFLSSAAVNLYRYY